MRRLAANPKLLEHIESQQHRTTTDTETFWGSQQFKNLDADSAGALTSAEWRTVLFSLGGDGVDLVNWGNRTATVLGLKLEDLPSHRVQTGAAVAPLIVIEGPKEPSNMRHVNDLVVDVFEKYAPSSDGMSAHQPLCIDDQCIV